MTRFVSFWISPDKAFLNHKIYGIGLKKHENRVVGYECIMLQ